MEHIDAKKSKILNEIADKIAPIMKQQIQHFSDNRHTISEMMLSCLGTMQWYIENQIGLDEPIFLKHAIMLKAISGEVLHWCVQAQLEDESDEDPLAAFNPSNN
jgi:hypothetical protein